jgi:fucose 4-O-acetylase-like acetyltransferase
MMKEYYDYLDFAKGIGIILVIIGHSIFPLHFVIDVFHMPLFFALAGITYKTPTNKGDFLLKKIDRVFIPYLFFVIISVLISYIAPSSDEIKYRTPWFFQTIFAALIIYMLLDLSLSKLWLSIAVIIFSIYTHLLMKFGEPVLPFALDRALCAMVFIHIGRLIKEHFSFEKLSRAKYVCMYVCMYVCATGLITSYYNVEKASFMNGKVYSYNYILFYIASIGAVLLVLVMSYKIKKVRIINFLGKHSLVIFAVHLHFVYRFVPFIATTSLYANGLIGKMLCALIVDIATILVCIPFIYLLQRYLPSLTGYKSLFSKK